MKNYERLVFWKRPNDRENWLNSMTDSFSAMPRGKILVYRHERIVEHTSPHAEFGVAASVASRLGGSLVQWPDDIASNDRRKWCYGIEKPTGGAA